MEDNYSEQQPIETLVDEVYSEVFTREQRIWNRFDAASLGAIAVCAVSSFGAALELSSAHYVWGGVFATIAGGSFFASNVCIKRMSDISQTGIVTQLIEQDLKLADDTESDN